MGVIAAAVVTGVFGLVGTNSQGDVTSAPSDRLTDSSVVLRTEPSEVSPSGAAPSDDGGTEPVPTPPGPPSEGVATTDRLQLPVGTNWDVDNWEESDDFDTWDFVLGSDAVKFHEWAEAGSDWTLDECEDPEFMLWSDSVNWTDVDSEHTVFCLRTTMGATVMLRIVEMPDWDQSVRSYTVEVTHRG